MSARICPSILNADRGHIFEEIERVRTADLLHLDVMDNIFVPNKTFTLQECREIIQHSPIPVDSHLMIADPDISAVKYAEMGSASVTFHFEASDSPMRTIADLHSFGVRVGLAIKPATAYEEVAHLLEKIDMLLIMTVEPGFGGQSFMADQLPKVSEARAAITGLQTSKPWLQVDGGISMETIHLAFQAGADTFVAGSAIYKADSPQEMIALLRSATK